MANHSILTEEDKEFIAKWKEYAKQHGWTPVRSYIDLRGAITFSNVPDVHHANYTQNLAQAWEEFLKTNSRQLP